MFEELLAWYILFRSILSRAGSIFKLVLELLGKSKEFEEVGYGIWLPVSKSPALTTAAQFIFRRLCTGRWDSAILMKLLV